MVVWILHIEDSTECPTFRKWFERNIWKLTPPPSLARSLTVYLDGELRLDLAPDVARLAAVDALVLVAPQVGDHQRRLHPVAVLVVRRQQDVVVLSIKQRQVSVAFWRGLHQITSIEVLDIRNECRLQLLIL